MPIGGRIRVTDFDVNGFNPANPIMWEEYVGDEGKRQDTITHGENLCTLRGYVLDHQFVLPALVYWLGYSWVDQATLKLKRKLPSPHPECNFLFASRVQISGWKYKDKMKANMEKPKFGVRVPFARYEKYLFEIDFTMPMYEVLPDNFVKANGQQITEWERFVSVDPDDETELITVDGGAYTLKGGNFDGKPNTLHGPWMKKVVERTELTVTAHNLPYDLLFNDSNVPKRLMSYKGKVNESAFLGLNPQTVVLKSFRPKKYPQPVSTETWQVLQFGVDVEFKFSYQEPTKAVATETLAGWNLVPGLDNRWDKGWYGAQTSAGDPIYTSKDFNTMLDHWST